MNRWNVIALYAAMICLISMGCVLFSGITAAQDSMKLMLPWYLEAGTYNAFNPAYQNNNSYISYRCPLMKDAPPCPLSEKSDQEITILRERDATEHHAKELAAAKMQAMKSLLDNIINIVIALLFFFFHWRIANRVLRNVPK